MRLPRLCHRNQKDLKACDLQISYCLLSTKAKFETSPPNGLDLLKRSKLKTLFACLALSSEHQINHGLSQMDMRKILSSRSYPANTSAPYRFFRLMISMVLFFTVQYANAEVATQTNIKFWIQPTYFKIGFGSKEDACSFAAKLEYGEQYLSGEIVKNSSSIVERPGEYEIIEEWLCMYDARVGGGGKFTPVRFRDVTCLVGGVFTPETQGCMLEESVGTPEELLTCENPGAAVGNPIDLLSGNKFQEEKDFGSDGVAGFRFSRFYNSMGNGWTYSYSDRLAFGNNNIFLRQSDGRMDTFRPVDGVYFSGTNPGFIIQTANGWKFTAKSGAVQMFDGAGKLLQTKDLNGLTVDLSYPDPLNIRLTTSSGLNLTLNLDISDKRLKSINSADGAIKIDYEYTKGLITAVTKQVFGAQSKRTYAYDENQKLSGIIDEAGVRYATFGYDFMGRANLTEHANGAQRMTIAYNYAGTEAKVTNSLGRVTTYKLTGDARGKRITSIVGEPSPGCPYSNSTFTYNELGEVISKIDNKGIATVYSYDERGREISRSEAAGTALEKITTTTWDTYRYLPLSITEPGRRTLYTYDNDGRVKSVTVEAVASPPPPTTPPITQPPQVN